MAVLAESPTGPGPLCPAWPGPQCSAGDRVCSQRRAGGQGVLAPESFQGLPPGWGCPSQVTQPDACAQPAPRGCQSSVPEWSVTVPLLPPHPFPWRVVPAHLGPPPHPAHLLLVRTLGLSHTGPTADPANGPCPRVETSGERGSQAWTCRHPAKVKNLKSQGHPKIHSVGPSTRASSALKPPRFPSTRSGWKQLVAKPCLLSAGRTKTLKWMMAEKP